MRIHYWSNSKFADLIRKLTGQPVQPPWATCEEWDKFRQDSIEASPLGYKLIESLNKIQNAIHWIPDRYKDIRNYFWNGFRGCHVIRTNKKFGSYSDYASRIPDGLMYSIIDFVEHECFYTDLRWHSEKPEHCSEHTWNYINSSRFKRKFMEPVSDAVKSFHGIHYLEYQASQMPEDVLPNPYTELIAAYKFAKEKYIKFDAYEESGYNDLVALSGRRNLLSLSPKQRECFDEMRKLEEAHEAETEKHLINIVKYHAYIWT